MLSIIDRLKEWHTELDRTTAGRFIAAEIARRFPELSERAFSIGDKVRVAKRVEGVPTAQWVSGMDHTVGMDGTISEFDPEDNTYRVMLSDDDRWWYHPDALEMA